MHCYVLLLTTQTHFMMVSVICPKAGAEKSWSSRLKQTEYIASFHYMLCTSEAPETIKKSIGFP